jgi:hypothetical protein
MLSSASRALLWRSKYQNPVGAIMVEPPQVS